MDTTLQSEWLTVAEAADHLKIRRRTLAQWARENKVPAHRLSGQHRVTWRFLRAELDAMLLPSSAGPADRRQQCGYSDTQAGRCATTNGARPGITSGMTGRFAAQSESEPNRNIQPKPQPGKKLSVSRSEPAQRSQKKGTQCVA